MVACVLIPLARCITQRKSPPRLDARPPTSVHVPMHAPTTLSELIALYLARCRIEGLSPRTQRAYSETLARFQRSVAAQGVPGLGPPAVRGVPAPIRYPAPRRSAAPRRTDRIRRSGSRPRPARSSGPTSVAKERRAVRRNVAAAESRDASRLQ